MHESPFPVRITRETILGSACWILTLEFFAGEAAAQLAWKGPPGYNPLSDAISDLGVTVCGTMKIGGVPGYYCSPLHDVMNASFVLAGVLILLGLYFTRSAFPLEDGSMKVGGTLLAIAGIGKITVGLNPANLNLTLHFLGALGIPLAGLGMIFMGRSVRKGAGWLGSLGLTLGVIGFVAFILFLLTSQTAIGGLMERIADYPVFVWMVALGCVFINKRDRHDATSLMSREDTRLPLAKTSESRFDASGMILTTPSASTGRTQ